jgi:hypothetical protein
MTDEPAPTPEPPKAQPAAIKTPRAPTRWGRRFTVLAALSSIVSVPLAIYFWLASTTAPRLMFKVSPSRSVVVAKSQVGGLRVLHGDQEIQGDVTAVQVMLWNRGHGPVKGSAVLETVKIVTEPPTPILVANVQTMTRQLTDVSLDPSALASGVVPVRFRILEARRSGKTREHGAASQPRTANGLLCPASNALCSRRLVPSFS